MKANLFKCLELRAAPNDALQALVIVLIGLCLALVSLGVVPKTRTLLLGSIPEVSSMDSLRIANFEAGPVEISVGLARSLGRSGTAVFVDARTSSDYARGHIPNAVNLPYDAPDKLSRIASIAQELSVDTLLIVYCDGVDCNKAYYVASELYDFGFKKIALMVEGLEGWKREGEPIVEAK